MSILRAIAISTPGLLSSHWGKGSNFRLFSFHVWVNLFKFDVLTVAHMHIPFHPLSQCGRHPLGWGIPTPWDGRFPDWHWLVCLSYTHTMGWGIPRLALTGVSVIYQHPPLGDSQIGTDWCASHIPTPSNGGFPDWHWLILIFHKHAIKSFKGCNNTVAIWVQKTIVNPVPKRGHWINWNILKHFQLCHWPSWIFRSHIDGFVPFKIFSK